MEQLPFVHLHVHTQYSLLDGAARIEDLVKKAVELGMPALAITDHGVMYGVIDFYKTCVKAGIKPIIGCEIYVAPNKRTDRAFDKDDRNYHLVLLARNNQGYRNLIKIVSQAHLEGFYYKPRADKELLEKHSAGLIALSACMAGEIPDLLLQDNYEGAYKKALEMQQIFGPENFYLEIQDHGIREQRQINAGLWRIHRDSGIPLVATNDVHYINKDNAFIQDVLMCIQTGKTLSDSNRMSFEGESFYLKTAEEMAMLFGENPEVLTASVEIAERCNVEFSFGNHYLPVFQVPQGYSLEKYLEEKCWESFANLYPRAGEYEKNRLRYELEIITQTGFAGYFLIVADLCNYARNHGITVGPGRGSAAASMVAYLLGITSVEPLRHDLLFERFLNPERISMPDIDIDFDPEGRDEVIRYVTEKYGRDKVCQIITFGTMGAKAVLRDVGRVLGIPLSKVDKIAKAVPNELGITLEKALASSPDIKKMVNEEGDIKQLYEISQALEGIPRHASTHAAGVVIAKDPLTKYLPLQRTTDDFPMTQFPMKTVEEIGLLKMDFLGLRNLTIIRKAIEKIKETKGVEIDLKKLPLDDEKTFKLLAQGNSTGVFQLESSGMRAILKDLKPNCFEDIIAVLALYRPGPMEQIPEFVKRKHGGKINYLHPMLKNILENTYGIIVYQEQVMQIARDLGGYSLGRADLLRRAMGKKDKKIMAQERQNFIYGLKDENGRWIVPGALNLGLKEKEAEEIFDLMAKFAEYGFNKGHATAYAMISYQTAYLKANYPLEFAASLLSSVIGSSDKVSFYIQEARSNGIEVLPPDVQYSYNDFAIEGEAIRFGLGAIRNVGYQVVEKIIYERENGLFASFYDFIQRMDSRVINKRVLESLVKAGALQSLCSRAQALRVLDKALDIAHNRHKDKEAGQISLFDIDQRLDEGLELPEIEELCEKELLSMEKEFLGVYLSSHPLFGVMKTMEKIISCSINSCLESNEERRVVLGGIITSYKQTITKKGEMMASFFLEDLTGSIEVLVFPRLFTEVVDLGNDSIVAVHGRYYINEDEKKIFAERVIPINEEADNDENAGEIVLQKESKLIEKLFLKLESQNNKELIQQVLGVLNRHKGGIPVYFYFESNNKVFQADHDLAVNYSPVLERRLSTILGSDNIKWKKSQ